MVPVVWRVICAASLGACFANGAGLQDDAIAGDDLVYLDGDKWTASGAGLSFTASVPGDLISDLYSAGHIENPIFEDNWLNSSIWDDNTWTYTTVFDMPTHTTAKDFLLVFDGVKMGAQVKVNGVELGKITDQFLRYTFLLKSLKPQLNMLEVVFPGKSITCGGRWMACTGGWDWAPYTNTVQEGARTMTKGIWKSVYLVGSSSGSLLIEHVVPQIFYQGQHAVAPLQDGGHAGFVVEARAFFLAQATVKGQFCIEASWGTARAPVCQSVSVPVGNSTATTLRINATATDIKLWWPAGVGSQPLYNLTVSFIPAPGTGSALSEPISVMRKVGFRDIAIVTSNDTDPAVVARAEKEEGSDDHGLYFRVNGALILSKGANMIPMEELEGWMDADAHIALVESAVDANMNTLRVWGGGMFLPNVFYDTCDVLGIMVYHDMMYAQEGHSPAVTSDQDAELRHQIRRLSHHASIIMWDGCNECQVILNTPTAIYATFVMTVVSQEDASRAVWPSCPARGWTKGVHKLSAMPNGNALETPAKGRTIEVHGPYQHGSGFPSANGKSNLELFGSNIPLTLSKTDIGPSFLNVFASEFGSSVMSSFESMSPTLKPEHWALHGGAPADNCTAGFDKVCKGPNVMAQRNYPCDNIIFVYFGQKGQDLNATGEAEFKKSLYQCMIGQALVVKQDIETRRSQNTFGIIVWQFNEIWPTGGWGSIEYGNPKFPGQVIGGRWKPLQHWYKATIFADVMATCDAGGLCYIRNDAPFPFNGRLVLQTTCFSDSKVNVLYNESVALSAGAGAAEWMTLDKVAAIDGSKYILEAIVTDSHGTVQSSNVVPFATPEKMLLNKANVQVSTSQDDNGAFVAHVTTDAVAMYVTLTTLAHGRFEDNSFLLRPPGRAVKFIPASPSPHGSVEAGYKSFTTSVRVEDVSAYMVTPAASDVALVI